jgi:nicotinic acid mononucleotide adenylyltransferase
MSSTKIREAVRADDWGAVDELTVPEIAAYIRSEKLYTHA